MTYPDRFVWRDQVFEDPTLSALTLRLAQLLANRYLNDDTGDAWMAQSTLAADLKATVRGVQKACSQLQARGFLTVDVRCADGKSHNRYRPIIKPRDEHTFAPGTNNRSCEGRTTVRPRDERAFVQSSLSTFTSDPLKEETPPSPSCEPKMVNVSIEHETFDDFWRAYPKRVGRGVALKAYTRLVKAGTATAADLLAGAMRYAAERTGQDPKYTKHPTTWLNGQYWLDEAAPPQPAESLLLDEAGNVVPLRRAEHIRPLTNLEIALGGLRQ